MAEYIIDRWLPGAIHAACDQLDFTYDSFSDDWILRIRHGDRQEFVFGYSFSLNSHSSAQIANDKVACYQILNDAGVPAMPHYLIRPEILNQEYTEHLQSLLSQGDIVLKPLSGTGGYEISRHHSMQYVLVAIKETDRPDWCVARYVDIASEQRVFMLDGEIMLSYRKTQPPIIDGLKFFNLGKGAHAEITSPTQTEQDLALRSMVALGLRTGAVDIVTLQDGTVQVVEVNCGIMLERFMRQSEEYKAIGYEVYRKIITKMMK